MYLFRGHAIYFKHFIAKHSSNILYKKWHLKYILMYSFLFKIYSHVWNIMLRFFNFKCRDIWYYITIRWYVLYIFRRLKYPWYFVGTSYCGLDNDLYSTVSQDLSIYAHQFNSSMQILPRCHNFLFQSWKIIETNCSKYKLIWMLILNSFAVCIEEYHTSQIKQKSTNQYTSVHIM